MLESSANAEHRTVSSDQRLVSARFPRSSQYHPDWVLANASGGANSLWLAEWLSTALDLRPGMRVLDLGCGRASSSIFLRREFGVQVWATDLWFNASENMQRIRDAGVEDGVFPLHADARSLPFPQEFFDAIVCLDSFYYFGTDDLYLNYLAQFVKPGGQVGIAGAGLVQEIDGPLPDHLREWWTQDCWAFHSPAWLRRHWERTGIMDVVVADNMTDGWQVWLDWHHAVAPDNAVEIKAIEADRGRYLGYVRVVGRRQGAAKLEEYCWPDTMRSLPAQVHEEATTAERRIGRRGGAAFLYRIGSRGGPFMTRVQVTAAVLALVFFGLTAGPARAQAPRTSSQEGQDILNYPLTLARANQLISAVEAMTKYLVSRPDFQDRLINSMKMTAAERRAQLETDPKAMAILKANGLTAHDYLVGVPSLRMALMAAQGPADAPNLAVSPANLAFAKANVAQLKPRMDAADGIKRK